MAGCSGSGDRGESLCHALCRASILFHALLSTSFEEVSTEIRSTRNSAGL